MIIDAGPEDAPLIARGIMEAIGEDICRDFVGVRHTTAELEGVFTEMARRSDSQYSWKNTRIFLADSGEKAGICVSYPGRELRCLRRIFFRAARDVLDLNLSDQDIELMPEETDPEEYYLDSLMVLPDFRGRGVAKKLIEDSLGKARELGLPLGLLVEPGNERARRLYSKLGFRKIGLRPFAGVEMEHLRLE